MRLVIAAAVVVVMGAAVLGVGMGDSPLGARPAERRELPPDQLAASRERIAGGDAEVRKGRAAFLAEGCGNCHTVGALDGADGELGPRLDRLDDGPEELADDITMPARGGPPGFPLGLMPRDYAQRMDADEIRAIARFLQIASGGGEAAPGGAGDEGRSPPDDD